MKWTITGQGLRQISGQINGVRREVHNQTKKFMIALQDSKGNFFEHIFFLKVNVYLIEIDIRISNIKKTQENPNVHQYVFSSENYTL